MYISDVLKMSEFKGFRRITNSTGKTNILKNIGIHDYESIEQIPFSFGKGDFVLTTLFVCKDSVEEVEIYINALLDAGIAGLAIKEVFYKEIPKSCIIRADELDIPILFYPTEVYAEDIIVGIKNLINSSNKYSDFQLKIDKLLKGEMGSAELGELMAEVNKVSFKHTAVLYGLQKDREERVLIDECKALESMIDAMPIKNEIYMGLYKDGLMFFLNYDEAPKGSSLLKSTLNLIDKENYYLGYQLNDSNKYDIKNTIDRGLIAAEVSSIEGMEICSYDNIGVYKMLLPKVKNIGLFKQCEEYISLINEHDKQYNSYFMETAEVFIDNEGDILETSKKLHQHPNTIRYRINKLKELLSENGNGYIELYLTMKVYKINKVTGETNPLVFLQKYFANIIITTKNII
jgi:hypothetical protein